MRVRARAVGDVEDGGPAGPAGASSRRSHHRCWCGVVGSRRCRAALVSPRARVVASACASAATILCAAVLGLASWPSGPPRWAAVHGALAAGAAPAAAALVDDAPSCAAVADAASIYPPSTEPLAAFALGTWDDERIVVEEMWWARVVRARLKNGRAAGPLLFTTRSPWLADVFVVSNYLPRHAVLRTLRRFPRAAVVLIVGENADASHYRDHYMADADVVLGYSRGLAAALPSRFVRTPSWMIDWVDPEDCGALARLDPFSAAPEGPSSPSGLGATAAAAAWRAAEAARAWRARPLFANLVTRHARDPRPRLLAALAEVGPVVSPSLGLRTGPWPPGVPAGDKHALNARSRFSLCPENSLGDGYVTEKLADAHAMGAIPLYWGADLPPDPDVFNPRRALLFDTGVTENATRAMMDAVRGLDGDPTAAAAWFGEPVLQPGAAAAAERTCGRIAATFRCALEWARRRGDPIILPPSRAQLVLWALVDLATGLLASASTRFEWRPGE